MKAHEVLKQYKGKNKNFQNKNLRGQSFKGEELSKADFSNAQLQGANFSEANLQGVIFNKAKLQGAIFSKADLKDAHFNCAEFGLVLSWKFIGGIGLLFLSFILGVMMPFLTSWFLYEYLQSFLGFEDPQRLLFFSVVLLFLGFIIVNLGQGMGVALWIVVMSIIAMLFAVISQPVIVGVAWVLVLAVALILAANLFIILPIKFSILISSILFILGGVLFFGYEALSYDFFNSFRTLKLLSVAVCFFVIVTIGIAFVIIKGGFIGLHRILAVMIAVLIPAGLAVTFFSQGISVLDVEELFPLIGWSLGIVLAIYIGVHALDDDPRYVFIRDISLNMGALGNTGFQDADLTNVKFNQATLQHIDLRGAILTYTEWHGAKKLAHARVGRSYLQSPQVRKLVVGNSGEKKNFDQLDLSGIKLLNARLASASFIGTNLAGADLQNADLSNANLVETNLKGANLEKATLDGACVENWYIAENTNLDNINCDYLYLRRPTLGDSDRLREPKDEREKLTDEKWNKLKERFISTEKKLDPFYRDFAELYLIRNNIIREYHLIAKAKVAEQNESIPLDSYRQMFKDYCRQKIENEWHKSTWRSIFSRLEHWIEKVNSLISEMDIFPVLGRLSELSVVIAVILFINQILSQKLISQYRGWEIINSAEDRTHGGVVITLKNWKKHGGSLHGIVANNTDLRDINLSNADLTYADFSSANLYGANLYGANLYGANLSGANLSDANLIGTKNLTPKQIKLACSWETAKYQENWDGIRGRKRLFSLQTNKKYIEELRQDRNSDPEQEPDCSKWEKYGNGKRDYQYLIKPRRSLSPAK